MYPRKKLKFSNRWLEKASCRRNLLCLGHQPTDCHYFYIISNSFSSYTKDYILYVGKFTKKYRDQQTIDIVSEGHYTSENGKEVKHSWWRPLVIMTYRASLSIPWTEGHGKKLWQNRKLVLVVQVGHSDGNNAVYNPLGIWYGCWQSRNYMFYVVFFTNNLVVPKKQRIFAAEVLQSAIWKQVFIAPVCIINKSNIKNFAYGKDSR